SRSRRGCCASASSWASDLSLIGVRSPTVKLGGYPRLWFPDGGHLDLLVRIDPDDSEAYEAWWRPVRVEWFLSPKGRLDRALPQTLPRLVHNANIRSWVERRKGPY